MKRANRLMLVAGVVLAAISFIAVLAFGGGGQQPQQPPQIPDVAVVVAASDLALGAELTSDSLTTVTRPEPEAIGTYQRPEDLIGLVVRRSVAQGQALTSSDFETSVSVPNLGASIRPGLRAIAIPLSRVDSVGALLQPGDYVDVIITLDEVDGLNPVVVNNPRANIPSVDGTTEAPFIVIDDYLNNTTVKVVVQNVQVLAALPKSTDTSNVAAPAGEPEPDVVVILAVTPQQAEVVRFAQMDGNVSLVLRAPGDYAAGEVATSGITLKELVERWGVLPPQPVTP